MNNAAISSTQQKTSPSKPMTLDAARKVMWVRTNHRPVGELFDEGIITRLDLKWAVEKAYSPILQQAAQVLLDAEPRSPTELSTVKMSTPEFLNTQMPVNMTLLEARTTAWPLAPYKGQPMGELVDKHQLTLKDLGYAVENAYEERVRRAATVLMLVRLNQVIKEPEPSAGLMHVVSGGRSFSERRQYFWALLQGAILGGILGASVMYIIWAIPFSFSASSIKAQTDLLSTPIGVFIFIILAVITLAFVRFMPVFGNWLTSRLDKRVEQYRQGHAGEERVVAAMHSALDGNWFLFRNVVLPGRSKADVDSVLIGPSGVWTLEIKTFTGEYRNMGEYWEYRIGNRWSPARKNPS